MPYNVTLYSTLSNSAPNPLMQWVLLKKLSLQQATKGGAVEAWESIQRRLTTCKHDSGSFQQVLWEIGKGLVLRWLLNVETLSSVQMLQTKRHIRC